MCCHAGCGGNDHVGCTKKTCWIAPRKWKQHIASNAHARAISINFRVGQPAQDSYSKAWSDAAAVGLGSSHLDDDQLPLFDMSRARTSPSRRAAGRPSSALLSLEGAQGNDSSNITHPVSAVDVSGNLDFFPMQSTSDGPDEAVTELSELFYESGVETSGMTLTSTPGQGVQTTGMTLAGKTGPVPPERLWIIHPHLLTQEAEESLRSEIIQVCMFVADLSLLESHIRFVQLPAVTGSYHQNHQEHLPMQLPTLVHSGHQTVAEAVLEVVGFAYEHQAMVHQDEEHHQTQEACHLHP